METLAIMITFSCTNNIMNNTHNTKIKMFTFVLIKFSSFTIQNVKNENVKDQLKL